MPANAVNRKGWKLLNRLSISVIALGALAISLFSLSQESVAQSIFIAPSGDESANYSSVTIRDGLDNPWGLAVRSGRSKNGPHELFIAESGAGRVIRILTNQPHELSEAIVGFPVSKCQTLDSARLGPLGLNFLARTKLIVTCAGQIAGQEKVAVYVLPGDNLSVAADDFDHAVGPLNKEGSTSTAVNDLFAITKTESAAFIAACDGQSTGQILRADIGANRLESLRMITNKNEVAGFTAPSAITMLPLSRPHWMVVADWGALGTPRDSLLYFLSPVSGSILMRLSTDLDDISGLAYSPSGRLYAVDCAWNNKNQGGVYRLDDARVEGRQVCRTVRIATIARPTSLAFAPDGAIYVSALGKGEKVGSGKLIKITGEF